MIEYYKLLDTVYGLQIKLIQDLLPVIQKKKTTRKWFKTDKMKQEEQNAINQEGFSIDSYRSSILLVNSLLKLPKEKWEDRENIYVRLICSLGLNGLAIDIPKYVYMMTWLVSPRIRSVMKRMICRQILKRLSIRLIWIL